MTFPRWSISAFFATTVLCGPRPVAADDSWQPLLSQAPADANVLVMFHAEKVRTSKFAHTTGWNTAAAPGGLRSLLPRGEIARVCLAASLNLSDLSPQWEIGVLETKSDASLDMFAAGVRRPSELLGTTPAVRLPLDAYLVKLGPSRFGVRGPADRQKTARWARNTKSAGGPASSYLQKVASFPETVGTEIMLGIDVADAADPAAVKKAMSESPTLQSAKIDADVASQLLLSIEGMALGVRVLDAATGMIRIDFTRDPSPLATVIKPLLLERLAARGMMIDDFQSWTPELKGNTAYFGGNLSPAGLDLILSLVAPELPPDPSDLTLPKGTPTSATSKAETAQLSKKYFAQVKQIVQEIRFPGADAKFVSAGAFGGWIDRKARTIDQLPILGVDPELVDYAAGAAKSLRLTAQKQRGATISASAYSNRSYYEDDGYHVRPSESPQLIQSRMENAAAGLSHVDILRMIDDETAAMRRKMTERYQIEF